MALLNSAEEASAAAQRLLGDVPHRRTQPTVKPSMNVIDVTELVRDAGQLGVVIYQERPIQVHASQRLPARASPEIVDRILSLLLDNVGRYIARALAREQGGELAAVDPHGTDDGARLELTLPLAENTQPL